MDSITNPLKRTFSGMCRSYTWSFQSYLLQLQLENEVVLQQFILAGLLSWNETIRTHTVAVTV